MNNPKEASKLTDQLKPPESSIKKGSSGHEKIHQEKKTDLVKNKSKNHPDTQQKKKFWLF